MNLKRLTKTYKTKNILTIVQNQEPNMSIKLLHVTTFAMLSFKTAACTSL